MLRAVFVRTLRPGVTYEQFREAWVPERVMGSYPAKASIGVNVADGRQVITVLEMDMSVGDFRAIAGSLTRPDALARLAEIVATTQLEGLFEDLYGPDAVSSPQAQRPS